MRRAEAGSMAVAETGPLGAGQVAAGQVGTGQVGPGQVGVGGLTAEERLLRDTAREFAQREIAPTAVERDEAERYEPAIFRGMAELGLTGAPLPESVGGGGFSYL